MLHSRLGRIATSVLLAGSVAFAFGSPASAATPPGIACKRLAGTATGTVTLKRCTGNTGGASQPLPAASLVSGGTITWVNSKTTTVKLTVTAGNNALCAAGSSEYDARGKTTADTTGSVIIGGRVKAHVCVDSVGNISLVPNTRATFQ